MVDRVGSPRARKATSEGASDVPLVRKLGIEPDTTIAFIDAPLRYASNLGPLPSGVLVRPKAVRLDLAQLFVKERAVLEVKFSQLKGRIAEGGSLWVSWPKRSSGILSDLSDVAVRDVGLKNGMVDVKVCSVDEVWSGLKFVRRSAR